MAILLRGTLALSQTGCAGLMVAAPQPKGLSKKNLIIPADRQVKSVSQKRFFKKQKGKIESLPTKRSHSTPTKKNTRKIYNIY